MIKTIGDLLEQLVKVERAKLDEFSIVNHPGLIGDMYEGLAREITDRALSPAADLRVVKGKIANSKGDLSRQIDCMIVQGGGRQLPYTDHWIYDVKDVIAVVEVKKTLYGAALADGIDLMADLRARIYEPKAMPANLLRDAWIAITGSPLPERPSASEEHLFHALMIEANMPVRILLGFDGYVSERGLRTGLIELLDERVKAAGGPARLGPLALPNLVLCRDASLIKLNGMPYAGRFSSEDGRWGYIGSRGSKPLHVLLELIWTRLTYYFGAPSSIFGEDLDVEGVTLLLSGRPVRSDEGVGWMLDFIDATDDELAEAGADAPWQPAVLTEAAFQVVNRLCSDEEVNLKDPSLLRLLEAKGTTLDALVDELREARLASVVDNRLELLTTNCGCVIDPELGYIAGENKSGRLERWMSKRMAARDKSR